jgi:putative DNA methylase
MPTKLIEVALPLDVINREAAREKSIRHGHPSTLHLWWARRPLAACRAVLFAQLVDDPSAHPELFPTEADQDRERRRLFDIIERLVPWESSTDEKILEEARTEIRRCYPDGPPPIVDPFCGGGSIPLEAQRLGLEAHASDLNPVAVLITKALIELPAEFADRPPVHPDMGTRLAGTQSWRGTQGLAEDIRYYGKWIQEEAERRIGNLYPAAVLPGGQRARVASWLWTRTVTCPNPACRSTMPLVHSFWLGKRKGKEAWVQPVPDSSARLVHFEIGHGPEGPPVEGTVGRSGAICLVCGTPVPLTHIRREGAAGRMGVQLMAVVAEGDRHRVYLAPSAEHEYFADVERPNDFPDTELPHNPRDFKTPNYGMTHHADLFTNRQLTALCTFSDLVGEAHKQVLSDSNLNSIYADTVATYLAFAVSKLADRHSTITNWYVSRESTSSTFARQAVPMTWDFAETQPLLDGTGTFWNAVHWAADVLSYLPRTGPAAIVEQADAVSRQYDGLTLSTDPPYYDNIGYADLSDYFYVWLRRSLRPFYPELLGTMLTPKSGELVATPYRFDGNRKRAEEHFELGFRKVFANVSKHAGQDTPIAVFYAFKQSESDEGEDANGLPVVASTGWEKMLEGLLASGLMVTGTWPVRTEASNRMLSMGTNALASSIVLVCRPRPLGAGATDRRGFIQVLKRKLGHALRDLQSGGVAPVDLAQASIGPGMAVFSSYAKVVEPDGTAMRIRTALALINDALDEVSAEQEGEFDEATRWAIAWYAENGMDVGSYGRADDLSRAKNVAVDGLVRAGIVKSGGGKVRLLDRDELDPSWDPTTDDRLTVWEITQHLIRRLLGGGEASAAELLAKVGGLGDAARDLAYRLFLIAELKKWSKEAGPYNALAASWLEISRLAAVDPDGQGSLFEGGTDGR